MLIVAHNLPLHMSPRYIGLDPTQVIWENLRIKWWERLGRHSATITFVCVLIIFWAIPTAVVGCISNINWLTKSVPFLRFIDHVPGWIKGVITGLLPSVLMSVLIALVPIILRCMCSNCTLFVELALTFYSDGQMGWCAESGSRRADHSKLFLCIPGSAGLLGGDSGICGH